MSERTDIVSPEVHVKTVAEWDRAREAKEAALHSNLGGLVSCPGCADTLIQPGDELCRDCTRKLGKEKAT